MYWGSVLSLGILITMKPICKGKMTEPVACAFFLLFFVLSMGIFHSVVKFTVKVEGLPMGLNNFDIMSTLRRYHRL